MIYPEGGRTCDVVATINTLWWHSMEQESLTQATSIILWTKSPNTYSVFAWTEAIWLLGLTSQTKHVNRQKWVLTWAYLNIVSWISKTWSLCCTGPLCLPGHLHLSGLLCLLHLRLKPKVIILCDITDQYLVLITFKIEPWCTVINLFAKSEEFCNLWKVSQLWSTNGGPSY